jgi:ligand-binding sensor domain-containing protein/two-component sensor histidine kinase
MRACLTVLLLLLCLHAGAQVPQPRYPFRTFTTANGLINNRIAGGMLQDAKGYLWISTDMGLISYNGRQFRYFPFPGDAYQRTTMLGTMGNYTVAAVHHWGLRFCLGDSVRNLLLPADNRGTIMSIMPLDDTSCYFTTMDKKIGLLRGNALAWIPVGNMPQNLQNFFHLVRDKNSDYWLGTDSGLYFFSKGAFQKAQCSPSLPAQYINILQLTPAGDLFVGCTNGSYLLAIKAGSSCNNPPAKLLFRAPPNAAAEVQSLAFKDSTTAFIASAYTGLHQYNFKTGAHQIYDYQNGLPTTTLWDARYDREGNLWLASENGLHRLRTTALRVVDVSSEMYNLVKSGCVLNDSVFLFSTNQRLFGFNSRQGKCREYKGYHNNSHLIWQHLMNRGAGKLWVTEDFYFVEQKEEENVANTYEAVIVGNQLVKQRRLGQSDGGYAPPYFEFAHSGPAASYGWWLNGAAGPTFYDGHTYHKMAVRWPSDTALLGNAPLAAMPDGSAWLWVRGRGLLHLQAGGEAPVLDTFADAQLLKDRVVCLYGDSRNRLWAGTRNGGVYLLQKEPAGYRLRQLPPTGFSSRQITVFEEGPDSAIWVGTAQGLDRIVTRSGKLEVERDLYHSALGGGVIYFLRKQGKLLFIGTTGKLGILDVAQHISDTRTQQPPSVYITGLTVNGKAQPARLQEAGFFKPAENNVVFEVTAPAFREEGQTRYRYKLSPADKAWSAPSEEYRINYASLPPDDYLFEVQAQHAGSAWSLPVHYSFRIAKPFWATLPFMMLVGLLIAGIFYGLYRYRIAQLMRVIAVRQKISKDLHDDIGAAVTSIGILANFSKSESVNNQRRTEFLETIAAQSRHVSEALADIVWSVNPEADDLDQTFARFQRYAAEIFEAQGIQYEFLMPAGGLNHLKLDMQQRQHLLLFFKEAVTNSARHAKATAAQVEVALEHRQLILSIADNGCGFDRKAMFAGNGLGNMQQRAKALGGTLLLESAPGAGTFIKLTLPVSR